MRGRKKGTPKTGGRQPGSPNRTTKEARELLEGILFGQIDNINDAMNELRANDAAKFIDACSKMFAFVLPKKVDVKSDDQPLIPARTLSKEEAVKLLSDLKNGF